MHLRCKGYANAWRRNRNQTYSNNISQQGQPSVRYALVSNDVGPFHIWQRTSASSFQTKRTSEPWLQCSNASSLIADSCYAEQRMQNCSDDLKDKESRCRHSTTMNDSEPLPTLGCKTHFWEHGSFLSAQDITYISHCIIYTCIQMVATNIQSACLMRQDKSTSCWSCKVESLLHSKSTNNRNTINWYSICRQLFAQSQNDTVESVQKVVS